jgi:hypothetical protein
MPFFAAIGTHLPAAGCDVRRIPSADPDEITPIAHVTGGPTAVSAVTIVEGPTFYGG